jgi:AAA+ superfamily predicted ATPase
MTTDVRLLSHLELLRLALTGYLRRLRALWAEPGGDLGDEVERLLVAVGTTAVPRESEAVYATQLLAQPESPGMFSRLAAAANLSIGEEVLLAAAWWAEADPQLAAALGCAHDDGARRYASASLVRLLVQPYGIDVHPAVDDEGPLVRHGLLEPGAAATDRLVPTATARLLLSGAFPEPLRVAELLPRRLERVRDALTRHLAGGASGVVLLRGAAGTGRKVLAADAICAAGLVPLAASRSAAELRLLALARIGVPVAPARSVLELNWRVLDPPLVAYGEPDEHIPGAYIVDVPSPSGAERSDVWRAALANNGLDPSAAPSLAARFQFTEGDIANVLERATLDADWDGRAPGSDDIWHAARRQPEHALGRVAALVTPTFTLDDLVLTERAQSQLAELVAHVALQHIVLDEWGFRRRLPRGQGVAALFAGSPGTGKTMAAEAIANELRQDLYRIDLSAVVSKYIGETEKNLASAFEEAERAGAVLFFDEADSLFGKRTEVRDAHDRYANLEINYLLQRVETFTGLVILASNRQSDLDEAFLRRLRFTIKFELPDEAQRRELWRRSFPEAAQLGEIDWDALAELELSGGSIQSAALSAAYLAAGDGYAIDGRHIDRALAREFEKLHRAWPGIAGAVP